MIFQLLQTKRFKITAVRRDRNSCWSYMTLKMETAVLIDTRKVLRLLHKSAITREMISKMICISEITHSNNVPIRTIKDRLIR